MTTLLPSNSNRRARLLVQVIAAFVLTTVAGYGMAASDPDQSRLSAPAGDGWQMLSGAPVRAASPSGVSGQALAMATVPSSPIASPKLGPAAPVAITPGLSAPAPSLAVAPVVLASSGAAVPNGQLTLAITPQDINLRNALDRWLQQQGWQLAWKIDDDLPLEFNATFSGDFKSVLTQAMQATNHMRTPTRICKHTNNVIRVVARAANCQE